MDYHTTDGNGISEINPSREKMKQIIASVTHPEMEFPDVSLVTGDGLSLTFYESGILLLEDLESGEPPRFMRQCKPELVLQLWLAMAGGDWEMVDGQPWLED